MGTKIQLLAVAVALQGLFGGQVLAAEGATGTYLLGGKQEMAGYLPPPGVYIVEQKYFWTGKANIDIPVGGVTLSGGVSADAFYVLPTLLWVTSGKVLGGNLAFSATGVLGWKDIKAGLSLTGPGGGVITANLNESDTAIGDPVLGASLGWHEGNWHWSLGTLYNAPLGSWKFGNPANIGFNRSSIDTTAAFTWLDPKVGFEISAAAGLTFNFENADTDYKTGTELHLEWALMQHLPQSFSIGLVGYHYQQVTGDEGAGATLGAFKGRVTALGASINKTFMFGQIPVNTGLKYMKEFEVENRLKGEAAMFTLSMPLSVAPTTPATMK